MPDEFEAAGWGTSSGLIDDVDVVISNAQFGYNADYQEGQTLLMVFTFIVDDADTPEATQFYSCGAKWETNDKGATAVREDGKDAKFNKNSNYAKWYLAAIEAGAGEEMMKRGTAKEAAVWIGMKFHVQRFSEEFTMRGETEKRVRETLLPTAYLGTVDGGAAVPKQEAASGTGESTSAPSATSNGAGAITGALKAKLSNAAKSAGNLDSFLEAAYGIDGVDGNKPVEDALNDFYAEVVG